MIVGSQDTSSFPASLRVINYIIEAGIPPSDGFIWNISTFNWHKVFRHLFRDFPYPIVFYSLLYRDEKLLRRIGQEMAYADDEEFRKRLPDILIRLLKAAVSDSTPDRMISSIFQMAGELFCSIDSSLWADDFQAVILSFLRNADLKHLSYRDDFSKFLTNGLKALRRTNERTRILAIFEEHYSENPVIFSHIIVSGLKFDGDMAADDRFNELIDKILWQNRFGQINLLVAQLGCSELLTEERKRIVYEKIQIEGLGFARGHKDVLHNLTHIIPDEQKEELKKLILEINFWDCGIEGTSYRAVDDFEIEGISNRIEWTEEEQKAILDNLSDNLSIIEGVDETERHYGFMKSSIERLLERMNRFLSTMDVFPGVDVQTLKNRVKSELSRWTASESLLERLSNGEYDQITDAINDIIHQIKILGFDSVKVEVRFVIDRALSKNKTALAAIINGISYLTKEYPREMSEEFGPSLLLMLKSYFSYDYEGLNLPVPFVNRQFINMAEALKPYHPGDRAVGYWMSEEVRTRFYGE